MKYMLSVSGLGQKSLYTRVGYVYPYSHSLVTVVYLCHVSHYITYYIPIIGVPVVVVCHDQVRRGSETHKLIPPDSAIDPLVISQSSVWCKYIIYNLL